MADIIGSSKFISSERLSYIQPAFLFAFSVGVQLHFRTCLEPIVSPQNVVSREIRHQKNLQKRHKISSVLFDQRLRNYFVVSSIIPNYRSCQPHRYGLFATGLQ
jgi:hypothetical protein